MPSRLGVVVAIAAATVATACGRSQNSDVASKQSPSTTASTTTTCPPVTTIVSPSSARAERLDAPWATPHYDPNSQALADFRMDPATSAVAPRLSGEQAIAAVTHAGSQSGSGAAGTRTVARFGLFTGNLVVVGTDPNHTLQGARKVAGVPAWLVVTDGIAVGISAGPFPMVTPSTSTSTPCPPLDGAGVTVIADQDGQSLANEAGNSFQSVP